MNGSTAAKPSRFQSIPPEEIAWKPLAAFPASVRLAVVLGHSLFFPVSPDLETPSHA
jgi:hypothetical protein